MLAAVTLQRQGPDSDGGLRGANACSFSTFQTREEVRGRAGASGKGVVHRGRTRCWAGMMPGKGFTGPASNAHPVPKESRPLGSNPHSAQTLLCGLGPVTAPLWALGGAATVPLL